MRNRQAVAWIAVLWAVAGGMAYGSSLTVDEVVSDQLQVREITMRPAQSSSVLSYSFLTNSGSTVYNESSSSYNGSVSGAIWTNAGQPAGSMKFDGVDDYINIGTSLNFPSWSTYSVSVWFLHNGGGNFGPGYGHKILDKTTWYHDWSIALPEASGNIAWGMYESGGAGIVDASKNYRDTNWHHCVIIKSGTNGQMWVDGVLKGATNNLKVVYSDISLYIGYSASGDGYQRKCWSGMIDQLKIFDTALASNEVNRLYTTGSLLLPASTVSVNTNLTVSGTLSVSGTVWLVNGAAYVKPLGDLSSGSYTNMP